MNKTNLKADLAAKKQELIEQLRLLKEQEIEVKSQIRDLEKMLKELVEA